VSNLPRVGDCFKSESLIGCSHTQVLSGDIPKLNNLITVIYFQGNGLQKMVWLMFEQPRVGEDFRYMTHLHDDWVRGGLRKAPEVEARSSVGSLSRICYVSLLVPRESASAEGYGRRQKSKQEALVGNLS
jgi:hypothetical protein